MDRSELEACVKLAVESLNKAGLVSASRDSSALEFEKNVHKALLDAAKNLKLSILPEHKGGKIFPDIIFPGTPFGVEVKTSKSNWRCLGNSVHASTRADGVDDIELVFGFGVNPIQVKSAPYAACVECVSVTHYPRFMLDMDIDPKAGYFSSTPFSFAELLSSADPVSLVMEEAKLRIGDGEWSWWMGNRTDSSASAPLIIRKWSKLPDSEQASLVAQTFAFFPEILTPGGADYDRVGLWLFTEKSVINTSLRDVFTSGGKVSLVTDTCTIDSVPKILGVLNRNLVGIRAEIKKCTPEDWVRWYGGNFEQYVSYADRFACWRTKIVPFVKSLVIQSTEGADEYRANCIQAYVDKIESS